MNLINNDALWLEEYRKDKYRVWSRVLLSNGEEYSFKEYESWYELKNLILSERLTVENFKLQYRSNVVSQSFKGAQGIYFVRSILGMVNGECINTITLGEVKGEFVNKKIWIIPGLIFREEDVSRVDECFSEALLVFK
jgi:hypothetical protein